ncbi:MAG: hypothetical protein FWE28_02335 [Oscillospiraceae bacterium]|nr:hypothetical protein [Oscillospiraceae bacterium]
MKKLAILLIAVLLIGALAACQASNERDYEEEREEVARAVAEESDPAYEQMPEEELDEPEEPESEEQADVPLNLDDAVVYDLTGLTLFNHDLGDSTLFEHADLYDMDSEMSVQVAIFQDGDTLEDETAVESSLGGIGLFYLTPGFTAEEMLHSWIADLYRYADEGGTPETTSVVRASADRQTALFAVSSPDEYDEVFIVLVQDMPGMEVAVIMGVLLDLTVWEAEDDAILAELGTHIGVDLHELVAMWW